MIIRITPELIPEIEARRLGDERPCQTARRILREGLKHVNKPEVAEK